LFLKSYNLTTTDYITGTIKFFDAYYDFYSKHIDKYWSNFSMDKNIKTFSNKQNNFIKKYNYYEIINTKYNEGNISGFGAMPYPLLKGLKMNFNNINDLNNKYNTIKNFDYVVIIPLSKFYYKMNT